MSSILLLFLSCLTLNVNPKLVSTTGKLGKEGYQTNKDAVIKIVEEAGKINVKGVYLGSYTGSLSYKLTIQKKGKGGNSNNSQSGKFKKNPEQKEVLLSSSSFNFQSNDEFNIVLEIFNDSTLISQEIQNFKAN